MLHNRIRLRKLEKTFPLKAIKLRDMDDCLLPRHELCLFPVYTLPIKLKTSSYNNSPLTFKDLHLGDFFTRRSSGTARATGELQ